MATDIKISILCEDQAQMGFRDAIFLAQHGFSAFIETDQRILFDAGATDVFIHNARLLGIDVTDADWIALSHGHWDHADGLKAFSPKENVKTRLLVHPGAFADRRKATGQFNGMACGSAELAEKFDLIQSEGPFRMMDRVYFLGEVPRRNDFEARTTSFFRMEGDEKVPDVIPDDTALAIVTEKGLVIVTGCSHAGICNIAEYAKEVTGRSPVHAIIGGFHLLGDPVQLQGVIDYFQENPVAHLYPLHCTDLPALAKFHDVFGVSKLCAGDVVMFEA